MGQLSKILETRGCILLIRFQGRIQKIYQKGGGAGISVGAIKNLFF